MTTPPPRFEPSGRPERPSQPQTGEPVVVPGRTPRPPVGSPPPERRTVQRRSTGRPAPDRRAARPDAGQGAAAPSVLPRSASAAEHRRPAASQTPPVRPAATRPAGAGTAVNRPAVRRRRRRWPVVALLVLALLLAWPIGLFLWADQQVQRTPALSGAADTSGTTYLLAGSDVRDGVLATDATDGARTDTIMLLHVPSQGPTALISLPRDTYTPIPGHDANKLNSAYSWGGAPLLVETVEGLTGLTVDHYVEVGFAGVAGVVDAVGGVELCLDMDVADEKSDLVWDAGCHVADGPTALAFARMRYSDPEGDIGRTARQQQLIKALTRSVADPGLLARPGEQVELLRAGTGALTVSEGSGLLDLGRLALAFRAATGPDGVTGTPPIASMDHRPGGIGSTVLLDETLAPQFFADLRDGRLSPGEVGGAPLDASS